MSALFQSSVLSRTDNSGEPAEVMADLLEGAVCRYDEPRVRRAPQERRSVMSDRSWSQPLFYEPDSPLSALQGLRGFASGDDSDRVRSSGQTSGSFGLEHGSSRWLSFSLDS